MSILREISMTSCRALSLSSFLFLITVTQMVHAAPKSTTGASQEVVEYRFVGATTEKFDANIIVDSYSGFTAMDKACSAEFGADAKAASIEEATKLVPGIESLKIQAWLVPGDTSIVLTDTGNGNFRPFDSASGFAVGRGSATERDALETSYCNQFQFGVWSASDLGPILSSGSISLGNCFDMYSIACSAPFAIPARPFPLN